MAQVYATPGVYIEEKNAFPNSVVAVATAVPAFIGYTERAMRGTKSLRNIPTRISSFAEFTDLFGGAPKTTYKIKSGRTAPAKPADPKKPIKGKAAEAPKPTKAKVVAQDGPRYTLEAPAAQYYLFSSMRLFFANGGGPCYIVSVGDYDDKVEASKLNDLKRLGGLQALRKEQEPTMVCIPDAMLLEANDCYALQQAVLAHCGGVMKNRMAMLDIHEGFKARNHQDGDVVNNFREGIGLHENLQFGAAYYPWLETSVIQANELNYHNISNLADLKAILEQEVDDNVAAKFIMPKRAAEIKTEIAKIQDPEEDTLTVANTLMAVSPLFKDIMKDLRDKMNLLPPAAAMAGIYSLVDNAIGVHKAPANIGVSSIVGPSQRLTSEEQEDLNLPLNGMAVNAIRHFVGKGTIVWGARTLDGNSQDWRYINVRRTVIMLEESLRIAAGSYVFEPNDANTWVNIKGMMSNFLTNQWKSGALVGASPQDAFSVDVGLGVTMTPTDVLEGMMKISIKVAISRPAEFIVITFQQQMQKS